MSSAAPKEAAVPLLRVLRFTAVCVIVVSSHLLCIRFFIEDSLGKEDLKPPKYNIFRNDVFL